MTIKELVKFLSSLEDQEMKVFRLAGNFKLEPITIVRIETSNDINITDNKVLDSFNRITLS